MASAERWNWQILSASAAVLLLAAILQVRDDGRVAAPGLANHPLPPACMSQQLLSVKCPGCGLTRSFIHLAHGRWDAAWSVHRLGWLLFLAAALQIPYRLAAIYRAKPPLAGSRAPAWFAWTVIALLIGNWLQEMLL